MKRLIITCAVVLLAVFGICAIHNNKEEDTTFRMAQVVAITADKENDLTLFDTEDGEQWAIFYDKKYDSVNPKNCVLTFDTLGTESIYDDEIVGIRVKS